MSLLSWIETDCDCFINVGDVPDKSMVSRRLSDQMTATGTLISVLAFESDEAMSRADIVKGLCFAVKELNETRLWLRLYVVRLWLPSEQLEP